MYDRNPEQTEFLQAVRGVVLSVEPVFEKHPEYLKALRVVCEPERQIIFRVPWLDDAGNWRVNRGFRVQFSSVLGPYKGGLRLHPSVNLSVIKFLGFEQIFKNALTTLPLGGGKGGSDFDPKGKSEAEIMRFCQSFMTELQRHIGAGVDVPAGDIGVGGREIGYLFGQYKRIADRWEGVLTGKAAGWGGSFIRPEATGYGAVYMAEKLLADRGDSLEGASALVSGSGNVAQFCAELLIAKGAKVLTLSDSLGYIYAPEGISQELVDEIKDMKLRKGKLSELEGRNGISYVAGERPWKHVKGATIAFPCATQNELDAEDAEALAAAGVKYVLEGANMPSTEGAHDVYRKTGVVFVPGKAANAGGVAVSGLEMAQNASLVGKWTREKVAQELQRIMLDIYREMSAAAKEYNVDLSYGADIAGFVLVAQGILDMGAC